MNKFGKALIAASIAFGGVTAVELATPTQEASAAMLYYKVSGYSYSPGTFTHALAFKGDSAPVHEGRLANWYIKDSGKNVKLSGTSDVNWTWDNLDGTYTYNTRAVETTVSSLPAGTYEVLYIYSAGGTEFRDSIYFTKSSSGSITVNK